jgi:hypothetical protein
MYAPNVKEMTQEEVRIAAVQQQRIIYWRAMEREGSVAPAQAVVGATSVRARRRPRPLAAWVAEAC